MEEENKHMECNCSMCQGWKHTMHSMHSMSGMYNNWRGHGHFLARVIVGLIILVVVFWIGVKVGEFKGEFENNGYRYKQYRVMPMNPMMEFQDQVPMGY